jgi:hypothetical protein
MTPQKIFAGSPTETALLGNRKYFYSNGFELDFGAWREPASPKTSGATVLASTACNLF